eukprot:CFRG3720T1
MSGLDNFDTMSSELKDLEDKVQAQALVVRNMKETGAEMTEVKAAVNVLKGLKKRLDEAQPKTSRLDAGFNKSAFEELMKRRFFYGLSAEIYGGTAGLYDLGPMGCALQANILAQWRRHFILEEQMSEIEACIMTPEPVLKASGHVDRFTDLMCQDTVTGENFRADHLLEAELERLLEGKDTPSELRERARVTLPLVDGLSGDKENLWRVMCEFNVRSPSVKELTKAEKKANPNHVPEGNPLSEPVDFNLMFCTSIGPTGNVKGFLRPETAQGIFTNFKRLYEFNNKRLPMAVAQIGKSFRNEIAPKSGLLRVREFTMAEIEHFVDPDDKSHPKFKNIRDVQLNLYAAADQEHARKPTVTTIGEAVDSGMVANETIGYYMTRIYQFLMCIGMKSDRVRFRQHLSTEMAHYATDCWDAECYTSYGWIECVGCADRSAYDLTCHSKATGTDLQAQEDIIPPVVKEVTEAIPNKQLVGKAFRKEAKYVNDALAALSSEAVTAIAAKLDSDGKASVVGTDDITYELTSDMVKISTSNKKFTVRNYTPSVIEPSFGIGRCMYALLEHTFWAREGDEQRVVLSLPATVAPIKVVLLPMSNQEEFNPVLSKLVVNLTDNDVSFRIDDSSAALGRRYARTDELGAAFACTVDFETLNDNCVTLREKDTMSQIRLPITDVGATVRSLARGFDTWKHVQDQYPAFSANA